MQAFQAWGIYSQSQQHACLRQLFGSWRGLVLFSKAAQEVRMKMKLYWTLRSLSTAATHMAIDVMYMAQAYSQKCFCYAIGSAQY